MNTCIISSNNLNESNTYKYNLIEYPVLKNTEYYSILDVMQTTIYLSPELYKICLNLSQDGIRNLLNKCTELTTFDFDYKTRLETNVFQAARVHPPVFNVTSTPKINIQQIAERQYNLVTRELIKHDKAILEEMKKSVEERKEKSRLQKFRDKVWEKTFERWRGK